MLEGSLNLYYDIFLTMEFTLVVIRIVISLVGLINKFAVFITIKIILAFTIWNNPSLPFRIILRLLFFLFLNI